MEHALKEAFFAKNELVKNGQIVEATEKFFAPHATTSDFDGTKTLTKEDMLAKMSGFANAIEEVNGIELHHASIQNNVSFAEFTFHFKMKDGSTILWHEIIRSIWEDGKIVNEEYFKA